MKYFYIILLLSFVFSCKKNTIEPSLENDYTGEVTGMLNNINWQAKGRGFTHENSNPGVQYSFSTYLDAPSGDYEVRVNSLTIKHIPLEEGTYLLQKENMIEDTFPTSTFFEVNQDAVEGVYELFEGNFPNEFIIDSYDSKTKEVEGRFQASFILRDSSDKIASPHLEDTILFRNCQYNVVIQSN